MLVETVPVVRERDGCPQVQGGVLLAQQALQEVSLAAPEQACRKTVSEVRDVVQVPQDQVLHMAVLPAVEQTEPTQLPTDLLEEGQFVQVVAEAVEGDIVAHLYHVTERQEVVT